MSDIQNVLLGGFGSTGSASLIVTSGFSVGAAVVVSQPVVGNGGYDEYVSKEDVDRFLAFLKKRKQKEEVEIIEEVVEGLEDSVFAEAVQEVISESKAVKPRIGTNKPAVDYQKLLQDIEAMKKLVTLYQLQLRNNEALVLLLAA